MQAVKGGEIPFCDRLQNRLEYLDIVGMGEEVAVQHHVNPDLRIFEQLGGKCLLNDIAGRQRIHDNAAVLQIVLECLPCQLEGDLKALDGAFFLQLGKGIDSLVAYLAQQDEGTVKVVEPLLPADIAIHTQAPSDWPQWLHRACGLLLR